MRVLVIAMRVLVIAMRVLVIAIGRISFFIGYVAVDCHYNNVFFWSFHSTASYSCYSVGSEDVYSCNEQL